MFGFQDMTGIILNKNCLDKLTDDKKQVLDIYLKICRAIVDEDTKSLIQYIPEGNIKQIVGKTESREKWLEKIKSKKIKYYGIELLEITVDIKKDQAIVKSSNKIRAKLYEYRGSWTVDSYLILQKENDDWNVKEILI